MNRQHWENFWIDLQYAASLRPRRRYEAVVRTLVWWSTELGKFVPDPEVFIGPSFCRVWYHGFVDDRTPRVEIAITKAA